MQASEEVAEDDLAEANKGTPFPHPLCLAGRPLGPARIPRTRLPPRPEPQAKCWSGSSPREARSGEGSWHRGVTRWEGEGGGGGPSPRCSISNQTI